MAEQPVYEYVEPLAGFGSRWPYGSCNVIIDGVVCGWPRRKDGTCAKDHPPDPARWMRHGPL
jgi:hypothetical protein